MMTRWHSQGSSGWYVTCHCTLEVVLCTLFVFVTQPPRHTQLCVTKYSKCELRTWSSVIPALSNINSLHTGPIPRPVSKFVAVPRWPSKRLVAPSARPRQARPSTPHHPSNDTASQQAQPRACAQPPIIHIRYRYSHAPGWWQTRLNAFLLFACFCSYLMKCIPAPRFYTALSLEARILITTTRSFR